MKKIIRNKLLSERRKKNKRKKELIHLEKAQSFGIVFKITNEEEFTQVKNFLGQLADLGKKVYAIAYCPQKEVPQAFLLHQGINVFSKKETTWLSIPKALFVEEFIQKETDVLIDLNFEPCFEIKWIVELSMAKMKVGLAGDANAAYDLMLETDKKDIDYYTQYILYYLNMINKTN